ncbi:MAG: polysaccharide deacetylase family protein [Pseudomonadota bacterium]
MKLALRRFVHSIPGFLTKAGAVLALVFLPAAQEAQADAPEAVILVYHRFGEDDVPSTSIRLAQLEAQLDWLVSAGASFPSLDTVVAAFETGRPLADFSVVFTVDDAYRSAAGEAWPRLKARGIPMTLFVATDAIDDGAQRMLDWDALRALAADGVTLGFHGAAHGHMAFMDEAAVKADFARGLKRMTKELGRAPALFAYPYGEYSLILREMVKRAGFRAAFAQVSGVASAAQDRYALPRFAINEAYGALARFRLIARARALPVAAVMPADPLITGANPPDFRFRLGAGAPAPTRITCYPSHRAGAASLQPLRNGWLAVDLATPLPLGRSRINCTAPGAQGRWYWFGWPFLLPGGPLD